MSLIIPANSASAAGGYEVANSLRFNDGSTDFLNHTHNAVTSTRKNTFSVWIKRSLLTSYMYIISTKNGSGTNRDGIAFSGSDQIDIRYNAGSSSPIRLTTNRLFRDVSAWYHIVVAVDTTQGTAANRIKLYVNGVQETSFATANYMDQNYDFALNAKTDQATAIGVDGRLDTGSLFDGYMAEFVALDGSQNAPTDFGEFDEDSGIWKPIDPSGLTFGNAGFYLDFENSGALGADVSGNSNNFTVNNLTAIDQSTDTCTNNFATMNPLDNFFAGSTFTEGNTTVDMTTSGVETFNTSTFAVSSGLWYAECKLIDSSSKPMIGVSHSIPIAIGNVLGNSGFGYAYMGEDGQVKAEGSNGAYGATYGNDDIIGIALDLDNNKLYFSKNGSFQNSGDPTTGSTGTGAVAITAAASTANGHYFFAAGKRHSDNNEVSWNFGSPAHAISSGNTDGDGYGNFEYAVPSGYYSLNTKNLAEYG